jgi:hypothetical protein
MEVAVSPELPAAKTTVMLRSCEMRVATLMGLFGSMPWALSVSPHVLLRTGML